MKFNILVISVKLKVKVNSGIPHDECRWLLIPLGLKPLGGQTKALPVLYYCGTG